MYRERERGRGGGVCGVMFIVVENGYSDPSSNPG